ncbi:signal transduction histidine kinase [Sphingomonas sp. BE138]|uniref:ATP-binding protein n=1 Tax=Sphingomonas sp. BE138 TaxID=2817845 RepID=UPI0028553043|nr:ATP-binding protein [Sphingomonas sp. BE138]MDR6788787.1 signal transduction histidine kinase [Sphingomonas sp. BE138]
MTFLRRPAVGLLGQVLAILLLTLVIEFGASTLLYERASSFAVRDDEANRLAEHLVISRRLIAERPPEERSAMAAELTTDRYALQWSATLPTIPPIAPALNEMQRQVIEWEPSLAATDLWLRLQSPGRRSVVTGGLRLSDGSWLFFRTRQPIANLNLSFERIALAMVPAIALMLLGGLLLRRVLLPLRRLATAADRVGHGAVEHVEEDGPGEVRRVITAFNRMQDRIQALIAGRTQALAAVGHDLRTPLARLHLRTEGLPHDETRDAIARDVAEMEAMITSLLAFLGGSAEPEPASVVDLAVLCATLADDAEDRGRIATYVGPDHVEWRLRRVGFKRALVNLVENALHYGDEVTITLLTDRPGVTICVEDDGPGIPDDELDHVLEPFVRLDPARARDTVGFGLGLSIVQLAVSAEGGVLTLENRQDGGLRAAIALPPQDTK